MFDCSAQLKEAGEYMYYSVSSKSHSFNPLYRLDIASRDAAGKWIATIELIVMKMVSKLVLDNSAYRFRVDNHYLFVSRKNATGNKEADSKSRRLYVTNNYGGSEIKFNEVQLPSLQDEEVRKCKQMLRMVVYSSGSSM